MKNGTGQLALIIILMLALFLQIEGVMPDIFAGSEEPIIVTGMNGGLEFSAVFDNESFTEDGELTIMVAVTNKSDKPIPYYAGTTTHGVRAALGAELLALNGRSRFTDKFDVETAGIGADAAVLNGELLPGKTINCEYTMLPHFMEKDKKNIAAAGAYILKLRYTKGAQETVVTELPVTVVKRFGKMYLKV